MKKDENKKDSEIPFNDRIRFHLLHQILIGKFLFVNSIPNCVPILSDSKTQIANNDFYQANQKK